MSTDSQPAVVRERPGCVLGIALGIMVLGSMIALLWLPRTEKRDGAKLLDAWLGLSQLPAGFEIRDATKFIGGEEVVQLANTSAAPETPLPVLPKPAAGAAGMQRVDWARVKLGAVDQLPLTLLFVHYPAERAESEAGRLFSEKLVVGSLDQISANGGRMILEIGTLNSKDAACAYVLERKFEPGGTFKDIVRVNLSNFEKGLALNAEWSRSEPFSKSRLQALIAALSKK